MGVVNFDKEGDIGITLRPKRFDIEVYQGDTFKFETVFRQPAAAPATEGAPVDVSGWTGKCQVKDNANTQVLPAIVTVIDGPGGKIGVDFGDTSAVAGGDYKYDLEMTDAGGSKRTFIGGKFVVVEDITE